MNVVKSSHDPLSTPVGNAGLGVNTHRKWRAVAVRLVVATLLLTAAGLKGHALWTQPISSNFVLGSRTAELAVIYGEAILAFWLLAGWQWPLAWLTSLVLFAAFAVRSGWQTWEGHSSCGCFGRVDVAPWVTMLVDLTAMTLLVLARPGRAEWQTLGRRRWPARLAWSLASAALLLAGGFSLLAWQAGSLDAALAQVRGDVLTISPTLADLGLQAPGALREVSIAIHNHDAVPVRIVGGTTDCGCATTQDLPITVPPGGSATIRLRVRFGGQAGRFQRGYWLWTDARTQPQLIAWFTGVVGTVPATRLGTPGP
jgi:hypothetical protein